MDLVEELLDKLEEWMEKSRKEEKEKTVYDFVEVGDEIEEFLIKRILPLPKEEIEELFESIYYSIDEEFEGIFSSVLRHLFHLNPHLYPFRKLWGESKSIITQAVESMIEEAEEEFPLLPPFGIFFSSSPRKLGRVWKVYVEPIYFSLIKNSFAVEIIFDYLAHLSPAGFGEMILFETETGEVSIDPKGLARLVKFIGELWSRETEKKKKILLPGGKLRKLMPVILNFIRANRELIEEIAEEEASFFVNMLLISGNDAIEQLRSEFRESLSDLNFENEETVDFLEEVFLKGMDYIEPGDIVVEFDSDVIYEAFTFLLKDFIEDFGKDGDLIESFVKLIDDLSHMPYISGNYNYKWMIVFTIVILSPISNMKPEEVRELMEKVDENPQEAFAEFIRLFLSSLNGELEEKLIFVGLILRTLFKSEAYEDILNIFNSFSDKEKETLFSVSSEAELIIAMSELFSGKRSKEEILETLEKNRENFKEILGGEEGFEVLRKLIIGEEVPAGEIDYPLDILYYYPYSEELYTAAEVEFDYNPKRLKGGETVDKSNP